jgi:hypothetical protein
MATASQVESACGNVERWLAAFRADHGDLAGLRLALESLAWLREQFVADRAAVEPHVARLREFSRQVAEELRLARQELVSAFLQATKAAAEWEARRETFRDALVELARTDKIECYTSVEGRVEVRPLRTLVMPKTGTPEREELTAVVLQSPHAAEIVQPNHARLLKMLEAGAFSDEQATAINRLCRLQTVFRLVARPAGAAS